MKPGMASKRGGPRSTSRAVVLGIVAINIVLAIWLTLWWRQRLAASVIARQHAQPITDASSSPEEERAKLIEQIEAWNARVRPGLEIIIGASSYTAHHHAQQQRQQPHPVPCTGTCDAADTDPQYRMRPPGEVAAEYPELALKLRQHAVNNEIMLTLANGVMCVAQGRVGYLLRLQDQCANCARSMQHPCSPSGHGTHARRRAGSART
jgi:hypothetical protein